MSEPEEYFLEVASTPSSEFIFINTTCPECACGCENEDECHSKQSGPNGRAHT